MTYTEALNYVSIRATVLKDTLKDKKVRVEYYFFALLLFANTDPAKVKFPNGEINQIKRKLESVCKKDLKTTEMEIRDKIKGVQNKDTLRDGEKYINIAKKYASDSYQDQVATFHLLEAILHDPTEMIKAVIKEEDTAEIPVKEIVNVLQKAANKKEQEEKQAVVKQQEPKKQSDNDKKIGRLMQKVSGMTNEILKYVKGQDHAIRAVAEGFFNAELLAESDTKRVRPRATFLFAGPPGVGKTFLAEQMADYLGLPHMRFDMSNYSDHRDGEQLIGQTGVYTSSSEGLLTKYVKENPKSILIFDEIEKAHMNVIYLFYQILEAGELQDMKTGNKVSFKDTYLIFTTNAGHNLYEGKEEENLSVMTKKQIISGIQNDINPLTKEPFFPAAMCSRLATGEVLIFNHLQSHNLLAISKAELAKNARLFEQQYDVEVEFDEKIPSLLMYREGGMVDARTLRAQSESFFKSQILQCLELFDFDRGISLKEKFDKIKFYAENFEELEKLNDVFKRPKKNEVLFFGNDGLGKNLETVMGEYNWNITSEEEKAFEIFLKKDVQVILLDVLKQNEADAQKNPTGTIFAFDNISVNSKAFDKARNFIVKTTEQFPDIPIYLVDKGLFEIDEQLRLKFIQLGVRAVVDCSDYQIDTYQKVIEQCLEECYLQAIAIYLKSKHQMVKFQMSPKLVGKEMHIRARGYAMGELIAAEDEAHLVADADRPTIKFSDVIGAEDAKEELRFFIEYLKNPKAFVAKGLKPAKGVLFYGPPGTGKTMLAKAMAGESDITFISESATNFVTQFVGSGPAAIRDMFRRARRYAPTILFIDEVDAIGRTRTGASNTQAEETTLNALLTEMDGFKVDLKHPVFIIAATNFKVEEGVEGGAGYIDPALVRRFDKKIKIDLLNKKERYQLFDLLLKKAENNQVSDKMKENIADRSLGRNSSNLSDIVSSAVSLAEKRNSPITDAIFEEAFETFVHGKTKEMGREYLEQIAWHEAGHAYMYWKNGQTPSYLTIVARGDHGGYMQHNEQDATSPIRTKEQILRNVRVALAGRAAEIVHFGKDAGTTTGISNDLAQATRAVKAMICDYGMDDDMGLIYIDETMARSPEMAMLLHKKTAAILKEQMQQTVEELRMDYVKISRVVHALLERNSMTGDEIDAVLRK